MANVGINEGTQSYINFTQNGTILTQVVDMRSGTLNVGTISSIPQISVGTIPQVSVGTIPQVSVGTIPNTPGGTLGVVSNLTNGSVRITVGTITVLPNIPGGTVGEVTSVTNIVNLAKGTITRLEGGTLGVVSSVADVANLAKGTITRLEGGTLGVLTSITNLAAGTITKVEGGSIVMTLGTVTPVTSTTPTVTSVQGTNVTVALIAANASRKGLTVYNDSTATLYARYGTANAAVGTYSLQLAPQAYYEVPFNYTGAIQGVWSANNGSAMVTEIT